MFHFFSNFDVSLILSLIDVKDVATRKDTKYVTVIYDLKNISLLEGKVSKSLES